MLGAIVLNGSVLWSLQAVWRLEQWRERNKDAVQSWFQALAEMDALCSLAGFVWNHPDHMQPVLYNTPNTTNSLQSPYLQVMGLAHPFLPPAERVVNDVSLDESAGRLAVITGANMAGKSTFLRALGLNTVLAMIGLPVCAREFSCSLLDVRTSMRTTDSLERHESYFFAELKRLQGIMEHLREHNSSVKPRQTLVLLDEILRGTNSADKKTGTVALLKQLVELPCLAVIATHDTEIGRLEEEHPALVRNYCFEGVIHENTLSFDYRLQRGVAHNKNATFLMQQMGIIVRV